MTNISIHCYTFLNQCIRYYINIHNIILINKSEIIVKLCKKIYFFFMYVKRTFPFLYSKIFHKKSLLCLLFI